jgi:hypothetical protein
LFRKEHASISASTSRFSQLVGGTSSTKLTSQPVDGPFLEVFQADLGYRRDLIEVKPVRVVLLLVCRRCKLGLPFIDVLPFGVKTLYIRPDHLCGKDGES